MPTTLIEIFRDSETHHRLSLFDLADLKAIEDGLFEKAPPEAEKNRKKRCGGCD